jgi:TM2 domain-containing membrane protein YozV
MYRIVGSDGLQYGPVSEEQLREWIAQGRVTLSTLVQADGSAEWMPAGQLPQFAALIQVPAPAPPVAQSGEQKSKIAAGLFGIFLGGLGVHRFYLGYTLFGVLQIVATVATCGVVGPLWGLVEGIMILAGAGITKDASGQPLKD